MEKGEATTRGRILEAGKREFLEKDFRAASLRRIVGEAGVTTGAFYGYFSSKEDLFQALVDGPAQVFFDRFMDAQIRFADLPAAEQPGQMGVISGDCMDWMVDYIYDHFDAFKLLICCAEGTRYEHFIHNLVQIEMDATHSFIQVLRSLGHPVKEMDSQLEHLLVSGMFSGFFEMVVHEMPKEQAVGYAKDLRAFYTAGWKHLMGF